MKTVGMLWQCPQFVEDLAGLEESIRARAGAPRGWSWRNGGCWEFALALHEIHGGELMEFIGGYKLETSYHGCVRSDGVLFDAGGVVRTVGYQEVEGEAVVAIDAADWPPSRATVEEFVRHIGEKEFQLGDEDRRALREIIRKGAGRPGNGLRADLNESGPLCRDAPLRRDATATAQEEKMSEAKL